MAGPRAACSASSVRCTTADGVLRLCLAQPDGLDLMPYLRQGRPGLDAALRQAIYDKPAGHTFLQHGTADRTMNGIGG